MQVFQQLLKFSFSLQLVKLNSGTPYHCRVLAKACMQSPTPATHTDSCVVQYVILQTLKLYRLMHATEASNTPTIQILSISSS